MTIELHGVTAEVYAAFEPPKPRTCKCGANLFWHGGTCYGKDGSVQECCRECGRLQECGEEESCEE